MADLKSKQIKFPLAETNVVSSSAQIATDISGSFVAASGSFSTRVTTAESELGNTLLSSSAQISTDISGSFVAPSASFSTRVTTAETELGNTLLSGSAQIATDISGSFTGELSGSHIKFVGGGVSGSAASTGSFGQLEIGNGGDIVLTEDQRIFFEADKATYIETHAADSFRIVVNNKQMFLLDEDTGDRAVFGNGTKVFIGSNNNFTPSASLHIAGNVWVSGSDAQGGAHVTASGNISSSATITSENSIVKNDLTVGGNLDIADTIFHTGDSNTKIRFPDVDTISFHTSGEERLRISAGGHITASGDISSSATITANEFNGIFNGALSSSAQIAADISGSLSTAAVVGLGANILSGSAQISADISGSFTPASASFSTRVTTAESELGNTLLSSSAQIADDVSGSLSTAAIVGLGANLVSASAMVDHDSTTNFVANEHINHTSVTFTAGDGLTGGGTIASNRTFAVGAGTGVSVNTNDVAIGQDVATTANVKFNHITGSGNISGSLGNVLGFKSGSFQALDALAFSGSVQQATQAIINHDSLAGFVSDEHIDHSGVTITAGAGLTGGGTIESTRTLAVGAGTGVTVNANDVAIGQAVATDSDVEFASVTTTGNITAQGDVIAQNYIVSSSVTHMTSSVRSGSTRSGDTPADDTHFFTGSVFISGSATDITNTMTASLASVFLQNNGHISSSLGTIKGFSAIDGTTITGTTFTGTTFTGVSGSFSENLGVNTTTPAEALEVVGSISSSASGSFLNVDVTDNVGITGVLTLPNIANVSASIASAVAGGDDLGNHTATQDLDMDGNDIFDVQHISSSGNISGSLGDILGYKSGSFQQLDAGVVSASSVQATNLTGLVGTATQGTIDHDSLANFVANEHVDHSGVTITAGAGLTGGGTIASTRTLAVGAGTGVTVNANDVAIGQAVATTSNVKFNHITGSGNLSGSLGNVLGFNSGSFQALDALAFSGSIQQATQAFIDHDSLASFVADEHVAHGDVTITAGAGLTGGGTIASTRTLAVGAGTGVTVNANDVAIGQDVATTANVKFNHITGSGNISGSLGNILGFNSGSFQAIDALALSGSVQQATQALINHDSLAGFVSDEHIDHTGVSITAGDGLTGGGTIAANRTINVVGGDGITANANDIAITAAQTTIESIYKSDLVIGEDDETQIDFETANEIHFDVDNSELLNLAGTKISGSQASTGSFGVLETAGNVNVTTNGRLGVGTDDPDYKLDVAGNAGFNEYLYHNGDTNTHVRFQADQVDISAGGNVYSYDGAAFNLTGHLSASGNISGSQIEASGDIIAFGSSDRELKDNIQPIENPLEKMEKIGGYTFIWNDKQSTYKGKDVGVVAQEIQEVLPEIVSGRANGYLGVKYEKIVPLLIESIKENTKKIKELEQEINEINKNCDCLNK